MARKYSDRRQTVLDEEYGNEPGWDALGTAAILWGRLESNGYLTNRLVEANGKRHHMILKGSKHSTREQVEKRKARRKNLVKREIEYIRENDDTTKRLMYT